MTDPSGHPTLHTIVRARAKIAKARAATIAIDNDLPQRVQGLWNALMPSNGAGIYADLPRFRSALAEAAAAIARAQQIIRDTDWPTPEDYDMA